MSNNSLVNLGDLSKPADTLIKKISKAVGGIFAPSQIRRIAEAEAEATIIKAKSEAGAARITTQSDIERAELHQRTVHRLITEEIQHQENMENTTAKALPYLNEDAKPDSMDDDWITNFFDKCRIVSDESDAKSVVSSYFGRRGKRTWDLLKTYCQFRLRTRQG